MVCAHCGYRYEQQRVILSSVKVAAFLAAAIATGAMLAVLVTAAGRGIAGAPSSPQPSVVAVASFAPASALATSLEPTASTAPAGKSHEQPLADCPHYADAIGGPGGCRPARGLLLRGPAQRR